MSCFTCAFYVFLYLMLYPGAFFRALMFKDGRSAHDIFIDVLCWIFLAGSVVALILVLVGIAPWMVKGLKIIVKIA